MLAINVEMFECLCDVLDEARDDGCPRRGRGLFIVKEAMGAGGHLRLYPFWRCDENCECLEGETVKQLDDCLDG